MSKTQNKIYIFETQLHGFINLDEPGGKYNTCGFKFTLPPEVLDLCEKDREELLENAKHKVNNIHRLGLNPPRWDEEGVIKYSYGGDTSRVSPVIIDEYGDPVSSTTLKAVREGTKVQLMVEQKAYWKPTLGTTVVVHGMQIQELVTLGSLSSREYDLDDLRELFGVKPFRKEALV